MQTAINFYAQDITTANYNISAAIVRKDVITKISLFGGILACLVLAINYQSLILTIIF